MVLRKSICRVLAVSAAMLLVFACVQLSIVGAAPNRNNASKTLRHSRGIQEAVNAAPSAQKPIDQDIDTFFVKTKAGFDKMAASSVLKSSKISKVNGFFMQSLKTHQPWHSLIMTNKKGAVLSEVIRIEGVSKAKRSVADLAWFMQVSKTLQEHTGISSEEKTGRYYLIWAAPIISKVKGKDTFQGAVVAQIDLWDCFDRFADKTKTPFMVRLLDRLTLYAHLWKDTITYEEKPLTVPGVEKIVVRYPQPAGVAAATRTADSSALEKARLDSMRISAASDSVVKAEAAQKKAKSRNAVLAVLVIVLLVLIVIVVWMVLLVKNRMRMRDVDTTEKKRPFDNL